MAVEVLSDIALAKNIIVLFCGPELIIFSVILLVVVV